MKEIGTYVNGNTIVVIYEDGTKIRYVKDGEEPQPEFPESMDVKITNRCNAGCIMCAESSTKDGDHANLDDPLFDTIRPYTELAIGGGDPFEHPDLLLFLRHMKAKRVICNITVNQKHFLKYYEELEDFGTLGLIHGVGVSIPDYIEDGVLEKLKSFKNPNVVVHTIAGYTPIETYIKLAGNNVNLLVLGFKYKGRGLIYGEEFNHLRGILTRSNALADYLFLMHNADRFKAVAFDNLAVSQLLVRDRVGEEQYEKLYMGDDGDFTMYLDMVKHQYAKSSTHTPHWIDAESVDELFANLKKEDPHVE